MSLQNSTEISWHQSCTTQVREREREREKEKIIIVSVFSTSTSRYLYISVNIVYEFNEVNVIIKKFYGVMFADYLKKPLGNHSHSLRGSHLYNYIILDHKLS